MLHSLWVCLRARSQSGTPGVTKKSGKQANKQKIQNVTIASEVGVNELNLRRVRNHFEIARHLSSDPPSRKVKKQLWLWRCLVSLGAVLHDNIWTWVFRDESFWHSSLPFVVESVTHELELIPLWEKDNAGHATSALLAAPSGPRRYVAAAVLWLLWASTITNVT